MKFIFKVSLANDIWNWQETLTKSASYGQDWLKNWPKDLTKKEGRDKKKLRAYLVKKYYRKDAVKKYAEWMQAAINPEIVSKTLTDLTGKKFPVKEVTVIITTNGRCPYDPSEGVFYSHYGAEKKWFYRVALHECMHFIVHKYYWKQMHDAGLSNAQFHDVKEAITVLLNPVFTERWNLPEKGYPNHQNLRKDIEKISKKTRDFDKIIEQTIKIYLKKYMIKVS